MHDDPQRMHPHPVRDYLTEYVARETGIDARRIGFMWTGPGVGVVTFDDAGSPPEGGTITVDGATADEVRRLELGEPEPDGWPAPGPRASFPCDRHFPHRGIGCHDCSRA